MSIQRVQQWLDQVCNAEAGVADGVLVESGSQQAAARWTSGNAGDVRPLLRAAQAAIRARQAIVENLPQRAAPGGATPRIVALPLLRGTQGSAGVALLFHAIDIDGVDGVVDRLGQACAELMAFLDAPASDDMAGVMLQIQAALLSQPRTDEAAAVCATRLAQLLGFERASVGLVEQGYSRVLAMSHGAAVDAQQEQTRLIAAAMDEAVDQGATIVLPAAAGVPRITLAHAALRRSGSGLVCSIPIVHLDHVVGAVTLERTAEQPLSTAALERCEHVVSLCGPLLALKAESELSAAARARRVWRRQWQQLRDPGQMPFKLAVAGGALLLLFAFFVPLPYSVSAVTRLEGSVQRALVAAADGYIQQIAARPGDKVKQGQVLAELAQQDLQIERSKRGSELAQHVNAYSAAFARADRATLMVSQARMEEARAQLELVESQIERTQVKAPFDGVVISGDLTQQLGAPIQRGAVLMVVAPADGYRLIVEVDERDINDVKAGAAGRAALAAMPGTTHAFRIERVTPLAATREGRHFFEVEGKLEVTNAALRPGLQGVARIDAEARPLASMLFGRLANGLRLHLWSWGWLR